MLGYQKSAIAGRTPRKQSVLIFSLRKRGGAFKLYFYGWAAVLNSKPHARDVSKVFHNKPKVNGVRPAADFWYPSMRQPAAPH